MKAILSRKVNGSFPDVGMNDRFLLSRTNPVAAMKSAVNFSRGAQVRIEYFLEENFYSAPPFKVEFFSPKGSKIH